MRTLFTVGLIALLPLATTASARDSIGQYNIEQALNNPSASGIDKSIKLYFGNKKHSKPQKVFGEFQAKKKTNAFNKTDEEACQIAFLSALISLQDRARKMGGNAVVDIKSIYNRKEFVSDTEFECGAGAFVAGSTLMGTAVKLGD